ncbi:MAG: bifunctional demethylmenaquinone methyltransferase/2-methoxy-6-polyprenyl-1,4-benzoquinol methylase UbiE [Phycisphaerales bacterium]
MVEGVDVAAAWTGSELASDPHAHAAKGEKVRRMFSAIARSYDLNNRVHSFWQDQVWRRCAVRMAGLRGGEVVLDVACGTGDLTRAFGAATPRPGSVTGVDFTPAMLEIAEHRRVAAEEGGGVDSAPIRYVGGDAMALEFEDASVDVVSIAFGIRNVSDPDRALREFRRVLRPGGRLVVLEFGEPRNGVVRFVSNFYTKRIMPITATLIARDRSGAYRYLPRSVDTFLTPEELGERMRSAGFGDIEQKRLSLGVCVCSAGRAV